MNINSRRRMCMFFKHVQQFLMNGSCSPKRFINHVAGPLPADPIWLPLPHTYNSLNPRENQEKKI